MWRVWDRWNNNDAKAKPTVLPGLDTRIFILANFGKTIVHYWDALSMTALPHWSSQKVIGSLRQVKKPDVEKCLPVRDKVSYAPPTNHATERRIFLQEADPASLRLIFVWSPSLAKL